MHPSQPLGCPTRPSASSSNPAVLLRLLLHDVCFGINRGGNGRAGNLLLVQCLQLLTLVSDAAGWASSGSVCVPVMPELLLL
jgi:hypothetical protein